MATEDAESLMSKPPHWKGFDQRRRAPPKKRAGEGTGDLFFPPSPEAIALREAKAAAAKARAKQGDAPATAAPNPRAQVIAFLKGQDLMKTIETAKLRGRWDEKNTAAYCDATRRRLIKMLGGEE
jgi:hypothetical protein